MAAGCAASLRLRGGRCQRALMLLAAAGAALGGMPWAMLLLLLQAAV
jgi:hypothetical protein